METREQRARWRHREIALAAGVVLAALAVRIPLLPHEAYDYQYFLSNWYDLIVANGYAASWQYEFSNYNPPYLYLLTAAAYFAPFAPKLLAVKAVSIAGDFLLAFFAYRCVRLRYPGSPGIPILGAGAVLLLPTVVVNGSYWGQSDSLYAAFLMACLYGLLSGRKAWALVAFGLALAMKLQAAFFAPLLYWLWAKKEIPGRRFALVPAVFLLTLVPAVLAGRPLLSILSIFVEQVGRARPLGVNAPQLYLFVPNDFTVFWPAAVALTAALVHGVRRLLERSRIEMTRDTVVFLALFSLVITPFFLPKMLNRYFFAADVVAIVLAFHRPRLWYLPIGIGLASFATYSLVPGARWIALPAAALLLALVVADLARRLFAAVGWRREFGALAAWLRSRRAAVPPLLLLSSAFVALFTVVAGEGKLGRPLANDGASAATLARAASGPLLEAPFVLPPPEESLPFRAEPLDPPAVPGGSAGFDRLLGVLLRHFDGDRYLAGDLTAQVVAARALMLVLYGGAALLAYFSLCRALAFRWPARRNSNRWIAVAATLLAFGSTAAAAADTVAAEGAPALFGVFLVFHGMVVFLGERRFGQLLVKTGAALLLGWSAYLLLLPFVALGLVGERRNRRAARGRRDGADEGAGRNGGASGPETAAAAWFGPLPARLARGPFRSPFLTLGAFSLAFAALSLAPGAISASGAAVSAPGEAFADGLRRIAQGVLPHAGAGPGRWADGTTEAALATVGALGLAAGLAGGVLARSLPLLTLALAGLGAAWWFDGGGFPGTALPALPVSLAAVVGGFAALRRVIGAWTAGAGAGLAAAAWIVPWAASFSPPEAAPGRAGVLRDGEAAAIEAAESRLREDFSRIRQALRPRPERTVFLAPVPVGDEVLGRARAAFFLARLRWTDDPAQRSHAELLVRAAGVPPKSAGSAAAPESLTPDNDSATLHHRATHDGELDDLLAGNPPRVRSEFEVRLVALPPTGRPWLVFAKDDCRPEHREGTFIVLLTPEDRSDLGRRRRPYGFGNQSFRFADRTFGAGERCVAGVPLPPFPIRAVRVGRVRNLGRGELTRNDDSYPAEWQARFEISETAPPDSPLPETAPARSPRTPGAP